MIETIRNDLQILLSTLNSKPVKEFEHTQVSSGSINAVYKITINKELHYCCKINVASKYPLMFEAEQSGLALLGGAGKMRVPVVHVTAVIGDYQVLVMEWITSGQRTPTFWKTFGAALSSMHHVKAKTFGLDTDNYMGALPQANNPAPNWNHFFYEQRILPQVKLAREKGLLTQTQGASFLRLPKVLSDLFPDAEPCLLHGDLWSGNFLCDNNEKPVLIDPAVYFGHPAVDLALTTLFGGFDKEFYQAYNYYSPLPANHLDQWDCCNLYPLLIHLNLFGRSYLGDILSIVQRL